MVHSRCARFGLLGALLLLLLTGGCWDQVGLSERTLVIGIGIDLVQGDDPILLTAQVVNTSAFKNGSAMWTGLGGAGGSQSGGAPATEPFLIETSKGRSLAEAIHSLHGRSSRRIAFSHNRIVVLGHELAQKGIGNIMDEMARNNEFRPTNWLLAAEGTAREIMEAKTDLGAIPAYEVHRLLLNMGKAVLIPPVNQTDAIRQFKSETKTAVIPLIRLDKETDPAGRIRIDRTAIFKGDRLVGILTPEESAGLLWFMQGQKGGMVVFTSQDGGNRTKISVQITSGTARITPRIEGGEIAMEITCAGRGILRSLTDRPGDPRTIRSLERKTEEILARQVERTIDKARRLQADFLGFGCRIHATLPDRWHQLRDDWHDEEFPRIKTIVRFRINLANYGKIRKADF